MVEQSDENKAIVLLSGGLDSATALAIAIDQGYICHALSVAYGQRHAGELLAAQQIAAALGVASHRTISVDLSAFGGSALTADIPVPKHDEATQPDAGIPVTYVPARNTVFLSLALAAAETAGAQTIFIGVTAVDYSGYPDCRPEFIRAFENMARLATKAGVEGGGPELKIVTPLIDLSKAEIIRRGVELGVDYALTLSCYDPDVEGRACGACDSCHFRRQGFAVAGIPDPTRYQKN